MSNTKTSLTSDAGRWISEQIIESLTEPNTSALDDAGLALTTNQATLLTESNRTNLFVVFGRPQSWNGSTLISVINVPVTVSGNLAYFSQNVAANVAANDTLVFETVNASPIITVGPFLVTNVNTTIVTLNTSAVASNTSMLATRTRANYDDVNVPNVSLSSTKTKFLWDNMIGGKLLVGSDMAHVVPRHDWATGTTYTRYNTHDPDLINKSYYVLTSQYHVFKCLDNYGNSPSTVEPSTLPSTDWTSVVTTSDGYVWKYMFSLDVSDTNFTQKFLTTDWMPVKSLSATASEPLHQWDVQEAAVDGALNNIIIKNGGSNFVVPNTGALTVTFVGGGGSGAAGVAVVTSTGTISGITATAVGSGYGTNISGAFTATVNSTILTHTDADVSNTYNGSYMTGNVIPANTYITAIDNSASPKKVYLSANATANAPVGTAVISGYPRIAIQYGGGANAAARAILTGDHIDSFNGSAVITNAGTGYVPPLVVDIVGDGSNAHAFVSNSSINLAGAITAITVDAFGNGYTNTTVTISGGRGSNAEAYVYSGPPGGHGSDPVSELGAHNLMIAATLNGDEGGNLVSSLGNDFRQVSFLTDPYLFGTTDRANASTFMQTRTIVVTPGVTNYTADEVVFQTDVSGNTIYTAVVERFDVSNNTLHVINVWRKDGATNSMIPDVSLPIKGASSTAFRNIITYGNPYLTMYSGKVLFIENMQPIVRSSTQVEYIRIVINQFTPSGT